MSNDQLDDGAFAWDQAPIENPDEGGFVLLPEGVYPFQVLGMERGRHPGSAKLPACHMATVSIKFDGGQLGETTVQHKLFLHNKTVGLLSQFFKGIGLRKAGDPLVFAWNNIAGQRGYAKLGVRKYEGRDFQEIKSFLDKKDWPNQQQQQQPAHDPTSFDPGTF